MGSFLHVRGPRRTARSLLSALHGAPETLSTQSCTTLTHLYQPAASLLRLYVWVLQRRGLTIDLVQNVVRFLLLRKDDPLDDSRLNRQHAQYTTVTRTRPRLRPKPAIVIALAPSQLSTLKQYADLFSASSTSHRAEVLSMVVSTNATGTPRLFLGFSGNSRRESDRYDLGCGGVTKASVTLQPPSESFTWPETCEFRSFKATFDVSDGSVGSSWGGGNNENPAPTSSLVDVLLNAPPKMRAELRVRQPVVNHVDQDDGGLSLWLMLPKGGNVSVDAPCISWQTDPPADVLLGARII